MSSDDPALLESRAQRAEELLEQARTQAERWKKERDRLAVRLNASESELAETRGRWHSEIEAIKKALRGELKPWQPGDGVFTEAHEITTLVRLRNIMETGKTSDSVKTSDS